MLGERFDTLSDWRVWSAERALDVQAAQEGTSAPASPNSSASIQQCNFLFPSAADGNNNDRRTGALTEFPQNVRSVDVGQAQIHTHHSAAHGRALIQGICPSMMHGA